MTDPIVSGVEADIAKVKTFWTDYRLYFVAAGCLLLGGLIGHAIRLIGHAIK